MSEQSPDLKPRTKAFGLRVITMYSRLAKNDTVAQVLGKQVLRSGTSVGANYREAFRARSKPEFISKTGDCLKEIEETEYWLELLVDSGCVPATKMDALLDETRQLIAILATINKKAKLVKKESRLRHPDLGWNQAEPTWR
jgi:four helix bundle protein